ncbi:unnamed protein product [Prorocentrum cordatum]|uniref:RRM domain-containing protein n=1 Tax=Prorocentrum cordatum TaxID=2364126 RepID=A0ABN9SE50_9DINO|nr:unnamed protein product [Polarella glacialis]
MPEGGWPDTDDEFGCGGCALRRMAAARRGGAAPLRRAADSAGPFAAGTASYVQGGARGHHADVGGDGAVTTLMIRNIPSRLSQQDVVSLLDSSGYAGKYDFLHVPCDFDTRLNKGHAFVNFDEPGIANALAAAWHGQHIFDSEAGQHPLNVAPSLVQGLEANMKKWGWSRYRRVRTSGFRPFIRGTDATEQ